MSYNSGGTVRGVLRLTAPVTTPAISAAGSGRIYFDGTDFQVSTNGGAYTPMATGGASGWTDDGTVVRLTAVGDGVGIGIAGIAASSKLEVLGDATRLNVFVTGGDPGGASTGGTVTLSGGAGGATGTGGSTTVRGGAGGSTSGAGGVLFLDGGPGGVAASAGGAITLRTAAAGAGTTLTERWRIESAGHLTTPTDNTYDIGAVSATRPRSVYVGTTVQVGTSNQVVVDGTSVLCGTVTTFRVGTVDQGSPGDASAPTTLKTGDTIHDYLAGTTSGNLAVGTGNCTGSGTGLGDVSGTVAITTGTTEDANSTTGDINISTGVPIGATSTRGSINLNGFAVNINGDNASINSQSGDIGGDSTRLYITPNLGIILELGNTIKIDPDGTNNWIYGDDAAVAATPGEPLTLRGGAGNTTGVGGELRLRGGAGGATGAGSSAVIAGGAGGSTSGAAGGVAISGGTPVDGNGGSISLTGSAGVGTNRNGGNITCAPGDATGTGVFGATYLTKGVRIEQSGVLTGVTSLTGASSVITRVDSTGGIFTVTLPAAASVGTGRIFVFKDVGGVAGTNNITIDGNAAETIDGATTYVMTVNYESVTIFCDGANWFLI